MKAIKGLVLILASILCFVPAHAKQAVVFDTPDNDTSIYYIVEDMPQFPGGDAALTAYISHNVHYPKAEKEQGIQGKVFVGFVVEKDGSITNIEIIRGFGKECDAEAIRVVKNMPKWKPGKQRGKFVRVRYMIPINFNIADSPQAPTIDTIKMVKIDKMPSFPKGEEGLRDFIGTNLRYPKYAQQHGISGRVFVKFAVEPDGSITDVEVVKGIGGGCDEEAVRVVKLMPKWIPGEKDGKKVRVTYTIPVNFRLPIEN